MAGRLSFLNCPAVLPPQTAGRAFRRHSKMQSVPGFRTRSGMGIPSRYPTSSRRPQPKPPKAVPQVYSLAPGRFFRLPKMPRRTTDVLEEVNAANRALNSS